MDALYEPGLRLEAATVTRFCNPFAEPFLTIRSIDYRLYGTWVDTMKELQMKYVYKEYPGLTHGPIMAGSMSDIYAFFAKHSRPAAR
jgi:hypothetical protein